MLALLLLLIPSAEPPITADLIVHNGKVWTGDAKQPEVQAVAVWRDRIVKVGTDAEVKALAGANTKLVDLKGGRLVPGFYDSHLHFMSGGQSLSQVDLKDAKDEEEFGKRLVAFDKNTPRERWIVGGQWDHDRTFKGALPTAAIVDKFVKDRPVFISRYDGHMGLANSAALKLAGITADTKDPPGGVIYRLADGKTPSGILKDNAMALVDRLVPDPGDAEILEAVLTAQKAAAEVGVTSVQDLDGSAPETRRKLFRIYQRLAREGKLTCRIDLRWPIALYKELANTGATADFGNAFVRIGGVKGFMDGSLGSSTAKMFAPYETDAKVTGVYVTEPDTMRSYIRGADAADLNVCVHAIGDQANAVLLDLFADVAKQNGAKDRRFRIEHAQHLRPEDYKRFNDLSVIASMQPYHVIDDGRWAEGRIGAKRCASSYAYRSLLDSGAKLAFGSDWPVAPINPLPGIDAAVNRRTIDGKHPNGWYPEQRITVAEAVDAYTLGSAFAGFQEKDRGSIAVGKLADFVLLSRDIFAPAEKDKIADTKVLLTVVGGKVVFERK
ncbi:amidohydrolase 3 : Amidohydrolase 3 OS=Gemmatimonadetes bacterium KBS708 GN=J421_4478 PE=4 SV=1: Amidohydro_3 [Gemmata massiliana]|uniref:Amidohydrolase 3 domain-containing protein n=1 Tax=Gemmata massiliana TaxID=1210884 RepID=A0A6P2D190_9BACT|nr:amidohydrolase [Gemmata massiliana]VTR93854.1 amidohydrolase 3 : Amidohydrolase 3 OS=Gemmatimonadetes bacterium KBS708 GN=J421_4478 PE=4 SV=1: Amidohydro_3 [Gemmata massiliana]